MQTTTTMRMTTRTRTISRSLVATAMTISIACAGLVDARGSTNCRVDGRYVMGTILELNLCDDAPQSAFDEAFATASSLDALFTTWADDSAVLRINRANGRAVTAVPAPVRHILAEAIEYRRLTGGAFDVSIGPLVAAWRTAAATNELPSSARLDAARAHVDTRRIEIGEDDSVRVPSGMSIDLGGLGKGFALDRITHHLRTQGIDSGLLDFGQSSLVALGAPPGAPSWKLLLRRPDGPIVGTVSLRDTAASTSATFGRSMNIGGRAYSHVIDPRTGRTVPADRLAFVTAPSASLAEALSTALIVLGGNGLSIVERTTGAEALFVESGASPTRTSGFDEATSFASSTDPAFEVTGDLP